MKCANRSCSAELHYLGDGKLFVDEVRIPDSPTRLRYAWLCSQCLGRMTVVFDKQSGDPSVVQEGAA